MTRKDDLRTLLRRGVVDPQRDHWLLITLAMEATLVNRSRDVIRALVDLHDSRYACRADCALVRMRQP